LTRRQCCGGLLAALGAMATAGCAPALSSREERELGREEAEEVERTVGLVRDTALVEYVRQIANRMVQAGERGDVTWQFNVADDSEANAFALPGGWVYVTRGLLSLVNSEDELAGVLGHEMAHVLERHAVRRVGAATPLAVLFGVPAGILGTVSPTLGGIVGGAGRLAAGLALAPYSREQEHEADRLGIALAARAGWDPTGLAGFLQTLENDEKLAGRDPDRPRFFSTHPSTPRRVENVRAEARSLTRAPAKPIAGSRVDFLRRLDGLVVGDNPANGVFLGPVFVHPDFDLALEMPARWKTVNNPATAGAVAPGGDAAVILQVSGAGDDPVEGARADGLGAQHVGRLRRMEISGLPAARLVADTRDGNRLALTWIAHRKRIFRAAGMSAIRVWEQYGPAFDRVAASFRPLGPADRERIIESRLRVRPARAGETVAQVLARGGGTWSPERMAVANGIAADRKLEAGWPVKVPVSQRYARAS
jgi:predicted Zn-dependent protease